MVDLSHTSGAAPTYRGRFAPTPSGPLHLGSLLTALASYLDARRARGRWLLRIDDLDRARCPAGAESEILRQLEAHALTWDETPRHQSAHQAEYAAALQELRAQGRVYACRCTRALLARQARNGRDGPVYPGTCRHRELAQDGSVALRFRCDSGDVDLRDGILGPLVRSLSDDVGDFVLRRADGIAGYHLACSVDETAQGITQVVRGADLLGSTFCQLQLMRARARPAPDYAHVPVLVDFTGRKLSKQNHALPLDTRKAAQNLLHCLHLLGQQPPAALQRAAASDVLSWAIAHWRRDAIPAVATLSDAGAG